MSVRTAVESEIHLLAEIWTQGWQDAHARIMPAALARLRTRESFRERLAAALPDVRVAGLEGAPVGFCMVKDEELYQLYVAPQARGRGIAAVLVADAETLLAKRGVEVAWLACVVGNDRAARFYEKGPPLQVWRYEKRLGPPVRQSDGAERRQPVRIG